MNTITIIGGGVSGLVTAYSALKKDQSVRIIDSKDKLGGMIHTKKTEYGLVETAANGMLNSYTVEQLIEELGRSITHHQKASKRRYFYIKGKWKRIPISFTALLQSAFGVFFKNATPIEDETFQDWSYRIFGKRTTNHLVEPALGGIYASPLSIMDTRMVFSKMNFGNKRSLYKAAKSKEKKLKPKVRGLISFAGGMQEFIDALISQVSSKAIIQLNSKNIQLSDYLGKSDTSEIRICLPLGSAYKLCIEDEFCKSFLNKYNIKKPELYSVASITRFSVDPLFPKPGFGVLFPRGQGIQANGVLSNDSIFPGRTIQDGLHSETWIYSGESILDKSEADLIQQVEVDRRKCTGRDSSPYNKNSVFCTIWRDAFPIYNKELRVWNQCLDEIESASVQTKTRIKFLGNYRRGIGLRSLIESAMI
jgi:oxygen-dependent protoporphyrinogen oxidase